MKPYMMSYATRSERCEACLGGGWLAADGSPFFDPDGEPVDWSQPNHRDCPSCLCHGRSLDAMSAAATPGTWSVEWDNCDCGGGYPCGHGGWIVSINDRSMDDLPPEDVLYMVALVNQHRLSKETT